MRFASTPSLNRVTVIVQVAGGVWRPVEQDMREMQRQVQLVIDGLVASGTERGVWPEFGAHGKDAATIRHALTFAVGVPGLPGDTTSEDLAD
jgi:hypothetical protein